MRMTSIKSAIRKNYFPTLFCDAEAAMKFFIEWSGFKLLPFKSFGFSRDKEVKFGLVKLLLLKSRLKCEHEDGSIVVSSEWRVNFIICLFNFHNIMFVLD